MSRAEQAEAFCSALLGGPEGDDRLKGLYVTLWTSGNKRTRWRRADEPGAVASLVAELDADASSQAVYICTTLTDTEPTECDDKHRKDEPHTGPCYLNRPKAAECAGLLGVWVEIDIAGHGHEAENLPTSRTQAQKIIDAMGLKPTLVISSGGGLHVWWMFAEPWLVRDAADPDAERKAMAALERQWVITARHHAEMIGRWKVDAVHDLARLLRPAGTTNRKIADYPRKVEILHHDPTTVYNPDDFEGYLPDEETLRAYDGGTSSISLELTEEQKALLSAVNLSAVWARVNSATYRDLAYTPEWLAALLEMEAENLGGDAATIGKTWRGERPDFKDDQNRYDAALMRALAGFEGVDTEAMIEALMCRRLRLADTSKADKINPRKRIDYITRTVLKFQASAKRAEEVEHAATGRIREMASARIGVDPRPEPEPPAIETGPSGLIEDDEQAEQAKDEFAEYASELAEHVPATDEEFRRAADEKVREEHTGEPVPPRPVSTEEDAEEERPRWFDEDRHPIEQTSMEMLTDLLIPDVYRERGVMVWCLETRDEGEGQRGRVVLRLPADFDWPLGAKSRPPRYRPGRPLYTEWWRRDLFSTANGFIKSVEYDAKISARRDGPKKDWESLIATLVPLWRKDSSGGDVATYAHEWLFDYLMANHGTGVVNEVGASGRPWVRTTNGWRPSTPPVIYVDLGEFLDYCRRQPGALQGRAVKAVTDYLKLTRRRPRSKAPGMSTRRVWYEIDAEQFSADEWTAIIDVTRHAYERSEGKRGLRAVEDEGGVGIDGASRRAAQ